MKSEQLKKIKSLFEYILAENNLTDASTWHYTDFLLLKRIIEEKTKAVINERTLKRLADTLYTQTDENIPKTGTLNILAQCAGYADWYDYNIKTGTVHLNEKKGKIRDKIKISLKIKLLLLAIGLTITLFLVLIINRQVKPTINFSQIALINKYENFKTFPNTFYIKYSILPTMKDSVFLHIICDQCVYSDLVSIRKYLSPLDTMISVRLKEPGAYIAYMQWENINSDTIHLFCTSDNWLFSFYDNNNVSIYYQPVQPQNGIMLSSAGNLQLTNMPANQIQRKKSKFTFINKLPVLLDQCSIEFRLRKDSIEGVGCNLSKIIFYGKNNRIRLQFGDIRCSDQTKILVSDHHFQNINHNIPALRHDITQWTDVKITIKDKTFNLFLNGNLSHSAKYLHSLDSLCGITFWFIEGGAIDYIRCFNAKNSLVFSEEFNQ